MRRFFSLVLIAPIIAITAASGPGAVPNLTRWFLNATGYDTVKNATPMAKPDFLGGTVWSTMPCPGWNGKGPHPVIFYAVWQLVKYDSVHHIALAGATTDQCSSSVFSASKPPVSVPSADLSRYGTARHLHVGSTLADVLATYGKTAAATCARHCVLAYTGTTSGHAVTTGHPLVPLPERIFVKLDDGLVSAITINVNLAGLF